MQVLAEPRFRDVSAELLNVGNKNSIRVSKRQRLELAQTLRIVADVIRLHARCSKIFRDFSIAGRSTGLETSLSGFGASRGLRRQRIEH